MGRTVVDVRFPFVYEDVDRHGNVRVYFWRGRGHPKVRIREQLGSAEFVSRYTELMDGGVQPGASADGRPTVGTWRWLCTRYYSSASFQALDQSTRITRRRILESTFVEPIFEGAQEIFADFPLARMTPKSIRVLRDRKATLPEAANGRLKAIRAVFSWALEDEVERVTSNPARDVKRLKHASSGYHSWTPEEVEQFEKCHPIGTTPRLAIALLAYTGVRRSDVVLLGKQHARQGWLAFKQQKNRNRHPVTTEIPILPELQRIIDASPTGDLTFLVSAYGRPFSVAGFGMRMREWCDKAGLTHCSAHGVRKAGAALAAENGATTQQLMSIFGWATMQEAERYTKAARKKKMAGEAMPLLSRGKT